MATLLNKQSGQVTISVTSITATPDAYVLARSILLFSYRGGDNETRGSACSGEKTNTTTLTFSRNFDIAADLIIEWQLFEFDTDVTVEDFSRAGEGTVAINSVTLANAFITETLSNTGTSLGQNNYLRSIFNSQTEIELISVGTPTAPESRGQVVEFTGCSVQEISRTIANWGASSTTAIITSVTEVDTILISTQSSTATSDFDDDWSRVTLTDDTTVTMDRVASTNITTIVWNIFVLEFTDGTTSQKAQHTLADADATDDITITSVTLDESGVILSGASPWGMSHGNAAVADDDFSDGAMTVFLFDNVTVRLTRTNTTGANGIYYQVIEWNAALAVVAEAADSPWFMPVGDISE